MEPRPIEFGDLGYVQIGDINGIAGIGAMYGSKPWSKFTFLTYQDDEELEVWGGERGDWLFDGTTFTRRIP